MIAGLHRSKPDLSQASEHVSLLSRSLINTLIMLNNQQNEQAVANYRDAEKLLREVNEMMSDIGRKIKGDSQ